MRPLLVGVVPLEAALLSDLANPHQHNASGTLQTECKRALRFRAATSSDFRPFADCPRAIRRRCRQGGRPPCGLGKPVTRRQLPGLIGSSCEWPPGLVVPDRVGAHRAALGRRQRADPMTAARAPELRQGTVVSSGRRRRFSFGLEFERQRCPVLYSSPHPRATGLAYPVSPGKALCRYFLSRPRRRAMSCASVVISSPLGKQ